MSHAGIMDALGIEKAAIIGHDWGSMLAWAFASAMPERTNILIAMSNGHPNGLPVLYGAFCLLLQLLLLQYTDDPKPCRLLQPQTWLPAEAALLVCACAM